MKQICRNPSTCKFGSKCRFVHPTTTPLLDPPAWIYTGVEGLDLTEISPDEVRYSLLVTDTRKILDDIWWDNYSKMYSKLNSICLRGVARSTSERVVDLRKVPEVFNTPFDPLLIEKKIVELRKSNPIVGEEDVLPGEVEESVGVPEDKSVPGFIKEYQEKKMNRKEGRDYNQRGDYSNRPPREGEYSNRPPREGEYSNRPPREGEYNYNRPPTNSTPPYSNRPPYSGTSNYNTTSNYNRPTYNSTSNRPPTNRPPYSNRSPTNRYPPYNRQRGEEKHKFVEHPVEKKTPPEEEKDFEYKNVPYSYNKK